MSDTIEIEDSFEFESGRSVTVFRDGELFLIHCDSCGQGTATSLVTNGDLVIARGPEVGTRLTSANFNPAYICNTCLANPGSINADATT